MRNFLLLAATLFLATALNLKAKTIKYPEKDPAFSITLPDDWTTKPGQDGGLDCKAGDGSKFYFSIVPFEEVNTEADVKAVLPKLAQGLVDGAKIENVKIGDIREMTATKKVKLFGLDAKGATSGVDYVITLAAFAPKKGAYFIIMSVGPFDVDKAHSKVMGDIINSITPLWGDKPE